MSMPSNMPLGIRFIPILLVSMSVVFCILIVLGSVIEIISTEYSERAFKLTPWFAMQWASSFLFWIFIGRFKSFVPPWGFVVYAVLLLTFVLITSIVVSIEQNPLSFLPIVILSGFFFAAGLLNLSKSIKVFD